MNAPKAAARGGADKSFHLEGLPWTSSDLICVLFRFTGIARRSSRVVALRATRRPMTPFTPVRQVRVLRTPVRWGAGSRQVYFVTQLGDVASNGRVPHMEHPPSGDDVFPAEKSNCRRYGPRLG